MTVSTPSLPRRRLGRTGFELSAIGVGGWLGMLFKPNPTADHPIWSAITSDEAAKEAASIAGVRRAISLGVNYFDTAPMYMAGEAQRVLGIGLKALSPQERQQVRVSTKVGFGPERPNQYDADAIRRSLDNSLKALFSDWIDIIYIHDPKTNAHMDQILGPDGAVEALEALKAQGVIGAIGLGVQTHSFLQRAVESGRFDAILPSYDYTPARRTAAAVMELAAKHHVGVVYGSPYLAGLLAGMDPRLAAQRRPPNHPIDLERAITLWEWAQARGVDLGVLAMQYCLRNPNITCVLAGPRDTDEIEANVRHATTQLPEALWVELDQLLQTFGAPAPGGEVLPPD